MCGVACASRNDGNDKTTNDVRAYSREVDDKRCNGNKRGAGRSAPKTGNGKCRNPYGTRHDGENNARTVNTKTMCRVSGRGQNNGPISQRYRKKNEPVLRRAIEKSKEKVASTARPIKNTIKNTDTLSEIVSERKSKKQHAHMLLQNILSGRHSICHRNDFSLLPYNHSRRFPYRLRRYRLVTVAVIIVSGYVQKKKTRIEQAWCLTLKKKLPSLEYRPTHCDRMVNMYNSVQVGVIFSRRWLQLHS